MRARSLLLLGVSGLLGACVSEPGPDTVADADSSGTDDATSAGSEDTGETGDSGETGAETGDSGDGDSGDGDSGDGDPDPDPDPPPCKWTNFVSQYDYGLLGTACGSVDLGLDPDPDAIAALLACLEQAYVDEVRAWAHIEYYGAADSDVDVHLYVRPETPRRFQTFQRSTPHENGDIRKSYFVSRCDEFGGECDPDVDECELCIGGYPISPECD